MLDILQLCSTKPAMIEEKKEGNGSATKRKRATQKRECDVDLNNNPHLFLTICLKKINLVTATHNFCHRD